MSVLESHRYPGAVSVLKQLGEGVLIGLLVLAVSLIVIAPVLIAYGPRKKPKEEDLCCQERFLQKSAPSGYSSIIDRMRNREAFAAPSDRIPKYEKELALFQTMSLKDQQEYLGLTKDQKLVKFHHRFE